MDIFMRVGRFAAIFCVFIIIVLSLLPAKEMHRTFISKELEHFVAYFGTGTVFSIGMARTRLWLIAGTVGLITLAAVMEVLQNLSPGRSPHLIDFLASSSGALFGVVLGFLIIKIIHQIFPTRFR